MTGTYAYNPEVWPAIFTFAVLVFLGQYSWRRRHLPGARWFAAACALALVWVVGTSLEISALALPAQVFWRKFQALWQISSSVAVTCFLLQFAGLGRWLRRRTYALLFVVPLLYLLLFASSSLALLLGTGPESRAHAAPLPAYQFWFFTGYVFALGLVNLAVLGWLALRSPRHRWAVAVIVGGQVLGRAGYVLERMDLPWFGPGEYVLFTIGVIVAAYAIAFFGFHLIDPVAVGRSSVLQQMREGMFVLDLRGRILDVNPVAAAIAGVGEAALRGRALSEVVPLATGLVQAADGTDPEQAELVLGEPGRARSYLLNATPLRGRDGERIGLLVLLHDVTEQKQAQARILDQQEVVATLRERERLARELHDGIGQVLGYLGMQAETALQWVRRGEPARAESLLGRLAEVARDAHADVRESILNLRGDPAPGWSFLQTLGSHLERFQAHHGIRTELAIADGVGDGTIGPAAGVQLLRVVQEALSNARRHGEASSVRVSVEMDGSRARLTIADDGRGFDGGGLARGDGQHFGLTFMRERVQQIGGTLEIDSRPGQGTILRLDVPARAAQGESREGAAG